MTALFLMFLNMSITAGYVAIAVIVVRFLLRRAPKIFSYMLWTAVAIRLIIPVSFASSLSIFKLVQPFQTNSNANIMEFISQDMGMQLKNPIIDASFHGINTVIEATFPKVAPYVSSNPLQLITWIACIIWLTGMAILLLLSVISYIKILNTIRTATLVRENIFETDQITTPFVCGFFKPKIYVPIGMSEHELSYILLHEQTHIRRCDYLIKPLAFVLLTIHWFNPLMWLSYKLMSRDMEMSCDEQVVNKMGDHIKSSYSTTLLSLSSGENRIHLGGPLAFGESHVKERIVNILAYRRPSSVTVVSSMLIIILLVMGCTANPKPLEQIIQKTTQPTYAGYDLNKLMKNKTLYIGDASRVGGIIGGLPMLENIEGVGIELQTTHQPYGLTIHYKLNSSIEKLKVELQKNDVFLRNAMMLLSLIDNATNINFIVVDSSHPIDDLTYDYSYTREQITMLLGVDVRQYSEDETSLKELIDRMNEL